MQLELENKILDPTAITDYTDSQKAMMIHNGSELLSRLCSVHDTEHVLESGKSGLISIQNFQFSHNQITIYYADAFSNHALREKISRWKELGYFTSSMFFDHGAIMIVYNCFKKENWNRLSFANC